MTPRCRKTPQDGPRWPQDGPKRPQDVPKMAPRVLQDAKILQKPTEIQWFLMIFGLRNGASEGAILEPSWAILGPLGAILGPSWGVLGPLAAILRPSWGLLGASWGQLRPTFGPYGPKVAQYGFQDSPTRAQKWPKIAPR